VLVVGGIDVELGDADGAQVGDEGIHFLEETDLATSLSGQGAFVHAVADDERPAAELADGVCAADGAGFDQAGEGFVIDGVHRWAIRIKLPCNIAEKAPQSMIDCGAFCCCLWVGVVITPIR